MSTLPAVLPQPTPLDQLLEMALSTCVSPATKRMYRSHLSRYLRSGQPLTREGVALHLQALREAGTGQSSLLGAISAIRKLANEAYLRQLLTHEERHAIDEIDVGKYQKQRSGNWLTADQVQDYLALPDRSGYWGKRDACILSLLIGCGLRRAELCAMHWTNYAERDGRMCLVDFVGKGNKTRTVPVPTWAQADCDAWYVASRGPAPDPHYLWEHRALRVRRVDHSLITGGMCEQTVFELVQAYGNSMGLEIRPHDLRRSLAQLLRKSGAPLEQIQYTLGHSDISTTVMYLGSQLELAPGKAAVDALKFTQANHPRKVATGHILTPEDQDALYATLEQERRAIRATQTTLRRSAARKATRNPSKPAPAQQGARNAT